MRYLFNSGAVFQFNSFLSFVNTIRIHSIPVCSGCDAVALMDSAESLISQPLIWYLQQHYPDVYQLPRQHAQTFMRQRAGLQALFQQG